MRQEIALFAPMVGLGAFNRYRLIPETAEAEKPTEAVRRIVGNVRFEAGLGIAVLVLAGLLTAMTPAASVAASTLPGVFALDTVKDGLHVHFESFPYPTTAGLYTLTILLNYDPNGTEFTLARNGKIRHDQAGRRQVRNLSVRRIAPHHDAGGRGVTPGPHPLLLQKGKLSVREPLRRGFLTGGFGVVALVGAVRVLCVRARVEDVVNIQ